MIIALASRRSMSSTRALDWTKACQVFKELNHSIIIVSLGGVAMENCAAGFEEITETPSFLHNFSVNPDRPKCSVNHPVCYLHVGPAATDHKFQTGMGFSMFFSRHFL
jgi:hypothetical protein